jgi:hypothetical protein
MIRVAGQSEEGYRVAAPAPIHLVVLLMWYVLYRVGYLKWWQNSLALFYLMAAALAVAVMKTRMLWGVILLFLPFVLLLKPPRAQLRQLVVFGFAGLLTMALMLHPRVYDLTTQIAREVEPALAAELCFRRRPKKRRLLPRTDTRTRGVGTALRNAFID